MGTFESFKRAYGVLKDSTTLSLAKVNSDFKDLDIAIVKATNHDQCPPKELHLRRIIVRTSFAVPRADVGYCIHALSKRLTKTKNWIVAVKILLVFHRILREGDPSFREELLSYSRIFQIQEFRDESSQLAWDCSSWVRMYALFLEQRLECYRVLRFDIETERLTTAFGIGKAYSRIRLMNVNELLEKLPAMQQLLYRLITCQPEGAACHNGLIQHAFALVLRESLKIYCAINDGIIKLVELFFNLSKEKAIPALDIYKRAGKQAEQLSELSNMGKHLRLAMNIQLPTLTQHPPSFLVTMEEYVKGASLNGYVSYEKLEHRVIVEARSPQQTEALATQEIDEVEKKEVLQGQEPELKTWPKVEKVLPLIDIDDDNNVPGSNETNAKATKLEDNNASQSALAIIPPSTTSSGWNENQIPSSRELSIPTIPSNSNNTNTILLVNMGGGFEKLLPYSLYEDDIARKQPQPEPSHTIYNSSYEYGMQQNPFQHHHSQQDPFMMFGGVVSPTTMQAGMRQHQQHEYVMNQQQYQQPIQPHYHNQYPQWYQQQQNMFMPYNQQSSNQYAQRPMCIPKPNPFGDAINHQQGHHGLI